MSHRACTALALLVAVSACSEPLEFADWTVPVPEGARVIEYDDPSRDARDGRIEMVEDLVIGARGDDPAYLFYRPMGLAVDDTGRIYVGDMGTSDVRVYEAGGNHLMTLGGAGQGPGELQMPGGLTVAADHIVVNDLRNARVTRWNMDGAHIDDTRFEDRLELEVYGTHDGLLVSGVDRRAEDRERFLEIGAFDETGTEVVSFGRLPLSENFQLTDESGAGVVIPRLTGGPSFAVDDEGFVYTTAGRQYQVYAFDLAGRALWALRAARAAPEFTEAHREAVLAPLREEIAGIDRLEAEWPVSLNTIGDVVVDGHGHLYVFEYILRDLVPQEGRRVEVYARDGERLFAGLTDAEPWQAAHQDHVYMFRRNPGTEEPELVRLRLVELF